MVRTRGVLGLIVLFLAVLVADANAQTATFQQGYGVGCDLGATETYYQENYQLFLATLTLAQGAGEQNYYEGVLEGYWDCRMQPTAAEGPGVGTICNIDGCVSVAGRRVATEAVVTGLPAIGPGQWESSTLGGSADTCQNGLVCAEFKTLDGQSTAMAPCCIAPENLGSDNPYDCIQLYQPAVSNRDEPKE